MIGFLNDPYTANEGDNEAFVEIGVISGSVEREIVFELSFFNGSALGNTDNHFSWLMKISSHCEGESEAYILQHALVFYNFHTNLLFC